MDFWSPGLISIGNALCSLHKWRFSPRDQKSVDRFRKACLERGPNMNRNDREFLTAGILSQTREITFDEALSILKTPDDEVKGLFFDADRIRNKFRGKKIHLCAIANIKSGRCSEDCGFCSQSAHVKTGIAEYDLMSEEDIDKEHDRAGREGAKALGLVAAWKGLKKGKILDQICARISRIASRGGPRADASLGIISEKEVAQRLKEAGLHCYNHNVETAPSYFSEICQTHSFEERLRTLKYCRQAGLKICSGGIIGMGESLPQRVELALVLKDISPDMLPLNFFNPIEGTQLVEENRHQDLSPLECLKTISMFRFVLPKANIMVAGGREVNLKELQSMMYSAGASAVMVGNYLTTSGRSAQDDLRLIDELGFTADGEL